MASVSAPERTDVLASFPPISPATIELLRSLSRNPALAEVAEMVMRDASLAAQVLKTANSARFAGGREVTDVLRATVRMGQDSIRRLAISLGMRQGVRAGAARDLLSDLLEHATATAVIAQKLAANSTELDEAVAYTGGLLRNMGSIALAAWRPERYAEIREAFRGDDFEQEAWETARFGLSSAAVGEWLAAEWELPQEYRAVMSRDAQRDHHNQLMITATTAAAELASGYGLGLTPGQQPFDRAAALERNHLDPGLAEELPESAEELLRASVV